MKSRLTSSFVMLAIALAFAAPTHAGGPACNFRDFGTTTPAGLELTVNDASCRLTARLSIPTADGAVTVCRTYDSCGFFIPACFCSNGSCGDCLTCVNTPTFCSGTNDFCSSNDDCQSGTCTNQPISGLDENTVVHLNSGGALSFGGLVGKFLDVTSPASVSGLQSIADTTNFAVVHDGSADATASRVTFDVSLAPGDGAPALLGDYSQEACAGILCGDGIKDAGEECDDGANNGTAQSSCSSACTLGPVTCTNVAAEPATLWPPNHALVPIAITGLDAGAAVTITGISQDEAVDGGNGDTCPDATGIGAAVASVRAERDGRGDGRVYVVDFTGTQQGRSCTGSVRVCVPHDAAHPTCGEQAPRVASTSCALGGASPGRPGR